MTLRAKLLVAQAPLLLALALLGVLCLLAVSSIGGSAQHILQDNYRSVLAAQRMKEAIERMDSGALFVIAGQREKGMQQAAASRKRFTAELQVEEANITERGEAEAAHRLHRLWEDYVRSFDELTRLEDAQAGRVLYFRTLEPAFVAVKDAADEVLGMNQDAMVHKSERAQATAQNLGQIAAAATVAAFLLGILSSTVLTARLLRPLSRLSRAAHRIGEGDLDARAEVKGRDELAQLAADFNTMAEHLKRYRTSSLGELLQVQHAAQSAIDSIPDPVLIFDTQGGILNINQAAESLLHAEMEPGAAEPLGSMEPAVREVLGRLRAHVLSGKGAYSPKDFSEAVCIKAADGEHYLLPRATPVRSEQGLVQGATVILQEVTRLRRFDELKNDLVATVAHEFRTPLTSLRMAVHLCLEGVVGPVTEKQADLLHAAREDCIRLQGIIDDLLDLARLSAGRLELRPIALPAAELVHKAVAEQQGAAQSRGVALSAQVLLLGAEEINVDPERIGLVFGNLISNAIRHTLEGGRIIVRARTAGPCVRFEVEDSGEGISHEYQRDIFTKFFRIPGSASGGAGLGLSIAKEIVQAHGGTIGVESQPGRGSNFFFTLPLSGHSDAGR
ncbi:MAG TPA: ATP-binding protein [Pseudomonadota bacterium]|nr:ATP-binding protein [Pseudomonadota bacterium]